MLLPTDKDYIENDRFIGTLLLLYNNFLPARLLYLFIEIVVYLQCVRRTYGKPTSLMIRNRLRAVFLYVKFVSHNANYNNLKTKNALRSKLRSNSSVSSTLMSLSMRVSNGCMMIFFFQCLYRFIKKCRIFVV